MSQAITKKPQLHDIPLPVEEQGNVMPNAEKLASKTNSLRRFFKIHRKRDNDLTMSASEAEVEKIKKEEREHAASEKKKEHQLPCRFHLRLGSVHKYDTAKLSSEASSSAASSSKASLKTSISSYWHAVFKRHQSHTANKKSQSPTAADISKEEAEDAEEEANETEIREEIHTLPISE